MDEELIDSLNIKREGIRNQSIRMFFISLGFTLIGFLGILINTTSGYEFILLFMISPVVLLISFALSIGGLVVGISEIRNSHKWAITGVIGNTILIFLPIILIIYLFYTEF